MFTTATMPLTTAAPASTTGSAGTALPAGGAGAAAVSFEPLLAAAQQQSAGNRPGMSLESWLAGVAGATPDGEALPVEAGNGLPPTGEGLPVPDAAVPAIGEGEGGEQQHSDEPLPTDELAALLAQPPAEPAPEAAPVTPGMTVLPSATPTPPPTRNTVTMSPVSSGGGMTGSLLMGVRAAAQTNTLATASAAAETAPAPTFSLQNGKPAASAGAEAADDFAAVAKAVEGAGLDAAAGEPTTTVVRESPARQYQHLAGANAANAAVPVPVGKPGWSEAVVDKVMWFSAQQLSSAEIQLNPPELGPLQVRVSTHQDQTSIYFSSHHAAVRDALDQTLPRLREMLDSQGIQLLDVGVGEHGSARRDGFQGEANGRAGGNAEGEAADDGAAGPAAVGVRAPVAKGLVDAYA